MLRGDQTALARLITIVEREGPEATEVLRLAYPHAGKAYRVGFTGPPGGGKSTLADALITHLRDGGRPGAPTIGVIAVDPSSPFTGGALLGDRIRMERHYKDEGVFIRSMGSRGGRGGVPSVAQRAATLLEASGKDYVFIETVGVGQTELDVMEAADSIVVVLVPEAGDSIQTMKAGLMEIGDIFVVNKADREGADRLAAGVAISLRLGAQDPSRETPVLTTQAHRGVGVKELAEAIRKHREAMERSGELKRRRERRASAQFFKTVEERLAARLHDLIARDGGARALLEQVRAGAMDPYSAALALLRDHAFLRNE